MELNYSFKNKLSKFGDTLIGTSGAGYIGFNLQSVPPTLPSTGFKLFANSSNALSWIGSNGFVRTFDGTTNTADRIYTLPNASGTFGLLESTQTWSGTNSFTGALFLPNMTNGFQQANGFVMSSGTNPILRPYNATTYDFSLNNSTSVIRVNSTGNVGIGTTTDAGYKLDVFGGTRIGASIRAGDNSGQLTIGGTGYAGLIGFMNNLGSPQGSIGYTTGATSTDLYITSNGGNSILGFNISGLERARFATSGNFLLNTTTDAGYKLDVNGTSRFSNDIDVTGYTRFAQQTSVTGGSNNTFPVGVNGIHSGFSGGIGTIQAVQSGTAGRELRLGGYPLAFYSSQTNTELGRFATSGNMLIGTTTDAGYKLDVNGTARISGDLTTNNIIVGDGNVLGATNLNITTDRTQKYYYGLFRNNSSISRFNGMKVYNVSNGSSLPASRIGFYTDNTNYTSSTEWMTINEFGNVGINTSSPTHTLTLGQGNTGYADYNTVDQTVNYERVRKAWSSNQYFTVVEAGGTGTLRSFGLTATTNAGSGIYSLDNNYLNVNQSGTAGYTANKTSVYEQALGSGSKFLLDLGINTAANGSGTHTSRFSVANDGTANVINLSVSNNFSAGNTVYSNTYNPNSGTLGFTLNGVGYNTNIDAIKAVTGTMSQTSGQFNGLAIKPVYNQVTSTASNTDLLINRTQTAIGSGSQLLIDAQVGGASKFSVANNGRTYINENLTVANVTTVGQLRLATIGTIFNTAPTSATDTGILGEIRVTSGFVYVCTATNTWVRTALATW
jgi:hypothetical protein